VLIGEQLGLDEDDLDKLQWAALLHDVGKLEVPASILNKDGRPTDDEWSTLARHPDHGERLIVPLAPWLGDWVGAIGQHHERWEGGGYPRGLRGDAISLSARIVAVADSFEVMTAARSYKPALSIEAARTELTKCARAQFDPAVVRAFLNVSIGRLRRVMGFLACLCQLPAVRPAAAMRAPNPTATVAALVVALLLVPALWSSDAGPQTVAAVAIGEVDRDAGGTTTRGRSPAGDEPAADDRDASDPAAEPGDDPSVAGSTLQRPRAAAGPSKGASDESANPRASTGGGNDTPTPPPTAPPPPPPLVVRTGTWYLGTAGPGDTTSSSVLPLGSGSPTVSSLANYDTDRDGAAGLLVRRGARQVWALPVTTPTTYIGLARVSLWAGARNFAPGGAVTLTIALQDCGASLTNCTTVANTGTVVSQTTPGFHMVDVSLGHISPVIAAGRRLVIRVQVDAASSDDAWLAYGTTTYPAALSLGQPQQS
jgi:hypothetical protein